MAVMLKGFTMRKLHIRIIGCLALVITGAALFGCSSVTGTKNDGRTANQQMNDSRITSLVEAGLSNEQVYKFNGVDVNTFNGVVQLSGFVDSDQQKARAGEIAQGVPGVARVENALTLKPQQPTPTGRTNNAPVTAPIYTNSAPQQ